MLLLKNQTTHPTKDRYQTGMDMLRTQSIYFYFISEIRYSKKRDENDKKLEVNNSTQVPSP